MPAFVPSSSQRGGQLLLDQLFNEAPDPIPDSRLDPIGPSFPQKQARRPQSSCYSSSWRDLRRSDNAGLGWLNEPEITPPSNSNHFPDGTGYIPESIQRIKEIRSNEGVEGVQPPEDGGR